MQTALSRSLCISAHSKQVPFARRHALFFVPIFIRSRLLPNTHMPAREREKGECGRYDEISRIVTHSFEEFVTHSYVESVTHAWEREKRVRAIRS